VSLELASVVGQSLSRILDFDDKSIVVGLGGFAGVIEIPGTDLCLAVSADSIGTKTILAAKYGRLPTIGYDLVNHCVDDSICHGASPIVFLDYIGHVDLSAEAISEVVSGVANACRGEGIVLIGGETAQLPGVLRDSVFDLVGFIAGIAHRNRIIDGNGICAGDRIIALPSNGLHTNGYSLARKIFDDDALERQYNGVSVKDMLLAPHTSYRKPVVALTEYITVKGIAHITGGGIRKNLARILPDDVDAVVRKDCVQIPEIFSIIESIGVPENEMYDVFNMGIGMLVVVAKSDITESFDILNKHGAKPADAGTIVKGTGQVSLE